MKNAYSVSQVNNYIKLLLEKDVILSEIFIQGEISNLKKHTSGHIYFSIKDEQSAINAVIFKNDAYNIDFDMKDGLKVIIFGHISLYSAMGKYQITAKKIEIVGKGDLKKDFEILKEKLLKEGIFDTEHKKPIPKTPKTIGVITSQTGAAIWDIINIYKRRNPSVALYLIPTLVQGNGADLEIIKAIQLANRYKNIDTIILARGGGSFEDLNCFNSEELARAIYFSEIPIVTGIGHEIDFTIADFVADFRAPTPSAAIEIALPEAISLKNKVNQNYSKIENIMQDKLIKNKLNLKFSIEKSCFREFLQNIKNKQVNINEISSNIQKEINYKIKEKNLILKNTINKLESVSPINILKNGYTFISDEDGKAIKSSKVLKTGDVVNISFFDGDKSAEIF